MLFYNMSGQPEPPQFLMPILETAEHVVEAPSAPYAYSKYLYGVVNNVVSSLNTLISNSNANDVETRSKLTDAFDDRALIRSELSTAVADEASARQAQDAQLQTAIDELNTWRNNNTDEISMEVDKAINSKVDDTLFQSVKTALETQDTQFSQDLANSIANRESKDAEHDALIARLSKFVDILTSGVAVVDANGNPINSFADVVVEGGEAPAGGEAPVEGGEPPVEGGAVDLSVWGVVEGQAYNNSSNPDVVLTWNADGTLSFDIPFVPIFNTLTYSLVDGVHTYSDDGNQTIRLIQDGTITQQSGGDPAFAITITPSA